MTGCAVFVLFLYQCPHLRNSPVFSSEPGGFALGHVVTSAHAQNVLYCVASNFLEVKQLASALLRQLPPPAVGLQVNVEEGILFSTFNPFK